MQAVIFDIDGTLLQSAAVDDRLYRQAVVSVLGPVEFRRSLDDYDFVTDSGVLAQVLADNSIPSEPDPTPHIKERFVAFLAAHVAENGPFREIPGAARLVDALRVSRRHGVAIATGGWAESAILKLESAGLDVSDIPLATSNDALDRVEIMRLAVARLSGEFESVTYYGDGPWDRAATRELGWNFIAVGTALGGLESFHDIRID